jgi:hypothetical protein
MRRQHETDSHIASDCVYAGVYFGTTDDLRVQCRRAGFAGRSVE